ncbi:protein kinase [Lentinula boryana]|uniref:Protein kinase n=1 Tax=Lentinula boryana TaxID=40481 RepID=A0ABQ8Q2E5_9AGAR|nr:protein kinase [Lentinula boryana]
MEPSPDTSAHTPSNPKNPLKISRHMVRLSLKEHLRAKKYGAHAKDEVPQRASVLNKFLEDDVKDRVIHTLNDFATAILDLPCNWEVKENFDLPPESKAVKHAFEAYLKGAEGAPQGKGKKGKRAAHERELYRPLANLLNILNNGTGLVENDVDEKMFYVQDPRPVLGLLLERKPDLVGIYTQLLNLVENERFSAYLTKKNIVGVFWGLLLFFVEVKHRNGNFIGASVRKGVFSSPDTLPTSNMPPPTSTTSVSSGKDDTARVTIHQSGSKVKTLEVGTSHYYEQKVKEELEEQNLTPTQGQRLTGIQCANYAKEMLSNGFIRNHAIGITADGGVFRFQYYDCSKVAFYVVEEEWKKLFMAMVYRPAIFRKACVHSQSVLDDFNYLRDPKQFAQDFKKIRKRAEGIIGRGSIVVEVECICTESGCKQHGERKVMKISFSSRSRPPEDALVEEARSTAESTGNHWALNHLAQIIDSITITYEESTLQGCLNLKLHFKEKYEERVMRVTVQEKLHLLSELADPTDFAQILYRDLSIGNIMLRRKDGKIYGVLNDFDLSARVQDMDQGPTSNHRTGTGPFMSIDLLNPNWEGGHLYRHDLEPLFYIMLCLACRYERPNVLTPAPRAYDEWFSGSDQQILDNKPLMLLLEHHQFNLISPNLRIGYYQRPLESLVIGKYSTSKQDETSNSDWITMNKKASYTTMHSIMSFFEDEPLETRWFGTRITKYAPCIMLFPISLFLELTFHIIATGTHTYD